MIYYIADMHFGHKNVIRFDNRPFADTDLMDEVLIHNWDERVTADDTVYVLGDGTIISAEEFAAKGRDYNDYYGVVAQ